MKKHVVQRGECLSSIAFEHGHFWRVVWDHPDNAALRKKRENPHVLMEGDEVAVPDLRVKTVEVAAGKAHRFRRKGVPETLRLRFGDDDHPRAGIPYTLIVDRQELRGATNERGELTCSIAPNAREAELILHPPDGPEEHYALELRGLDPVTELTGVQKRLRNLHLYAGPVNGELTPATVRAMREFQARQGLPLTDAPDDATREALLDVHGV